MTATFKHHRTTYTFDDLTTAFENTDLDSDSDEVTLVIGLDFGTTYSGIAYAFSNKPKSIYNIEDWPGAGGRSYAKCPTLIEYQSPTAFKWGFEVDKTSSGCIEGIKLLLDPDQPKPIYAPSISPTPELLKLRKAPVTVVSEYINAIYQHAMKIIESKFPRDYLTTLPKRHIISVPAVWSDKAKDATLRAAQSAGLRPVKLVKEPEAAALFTMQSMEGKGFMVGDAIILCDAGGGTVDLIGYEIAKLQPLELREITIASGGLAGSLLINKRFEDWIRGVVGDRAYSDLRKSKAYRRAMEDFDDSIKPGFRSQDDEERYIIFPGARLQDNLAAGLERDAIKVTGDTLFGIFDPIFREINRLIIEQVKDARLNRLAKGQANVMDIKAIFLVGGFGANKYILQQVTTSNPRVQVIQPNDAWSAIVRGTVMSGLPTTIQVVTSIAAKHYGVEYGADYDDVCDAGREKWWDEDYEVWRLRGIRWYIEKGDDLERARTIEFPFYRSFDPNQSKRHLVVKDILYESSNDSKSRYACDSGIISNCTLTTDLSMVPESQFRKKSRSTVSGKVHSWCELHYKLLVTIQSGPMIFSLDCGGVRYGEVDAQY